MEGENRIRGLDRDIRQDDQHHTGKYGSIPVDSLDSNSRVSDRAHGALVARDSRIL
jgi:hypothetical protein